MKILTVTEPSTEQYKFIAGPAMFGARLGGKSEYQVIKQMHPLSLITFDVSIIVIVIVYPPNNVYILLLFFIIVLLLFVLLCCYWLGGGSTCGFHFSCRWVWPI